MDKSEFILRQLCRANHKIYENYVVTRIWHLLNNTNIKFVTQQLVRSDSGRALTDIYFPQLDIHVEVDERHHLNQLEADTERELGIVTATGHQIKRIKADGKELETIHQQVTSLVEEINKLWKDKGSPVWDFDKEFSPEKYIKKGYVHSEEKDDFRRIVDACNSFGCNYRGFQQATCRHPREENTSLWFPKLFNSTDWTNKLSQDEEHIYEEKKT